MGRTALLAAGWASAAANLLHLAIIFGGAEWYRFFGAGEPMARAAERGSPVPAMFTLVIAVILAVWALYAFSAAGQSRRLPLTRTALIAIATVLLARAALAFVPSAWAPDQTFAFIAWTSAICFAMGGLFAIGTWHVWPQLSRRSR